MHKTKRRATKTPGLTKPQPSSKSRTTKDPVAVVPIKPVLSSAHRVPNARDSRRKAGVPDLARWTGRRRTGSAAHRKASDLVRPSVAEAAANALEVAAVTVGVAEAASVAVAGVDDEMSQLKWWPL